MFSACPRAARRSGTNIHDGQRDRETLMRGRFHEGVREPPNIPRGSCLLVETNPMQSAMPDSDKEAEFQRDDKRAWWGCMVYRNSAR